MVAAPDFISGREALHRLDDAGCDAIVIARVDEADAWAAVRDRLRRATAT